MQSLPLALAARPGLDVRCSRTVKAVERHEGRWRVTVEEEGEAIPADAVVLAGEPWSMAALLSGDATELSAELAAVPCPPVAVVALGFGEEALARVPRGFGALIPRGEGYRILGVLWDTHLFPARSPDRRLLMRVMLGGSVDPGVGSLSSQELLTVAREDVGRLLGLHGEPVFSKVVLWPRAIPQYELGHLDRVSRVATHLGRLPGLFVAGNGLEGVAFTRSAATGLSCGERAVEHLRGARGQDRSATG